MGNKKSKKTFLVLIGILVGFFAIDYFGGWRLVKSGVERLVVIPVKDSVYRLTRARQTDLGSCQLQEQRRLAELTAKIALLEEENREQKRLLSAKLPSDWQFVTAKVIGLSGEEIEINRGRVDGVVVDQSVVVGQTLVGRVTHVSEAVAKVQLLTSSDSRIAVRVVQGVDKQLAGKGLLVGRGEGKMRLEQVLASEVIVGGDLVIALFGKGEVVAGEVLEVVLDPGGVFKNATVKSLVNPEDLITVFVVKK